MASLNDMSDVDWQALPYSKLPPTTAGTDTAKTRVASHNPEGGAKFHVFLPAPQPGA